MQIYGNIQKIWKGVVMKVKHVKLTNYRGFKNLSMELNPRLNVFVGVNGSGKSTVMDAVALILSWVVSRIERDGASGRIIQESNIANGEPDASIEILCEMKSKTIKWKLAGALKSSAVSGNEANLQELNEYTREIRDKISETSEKINLPILSYYPANRDIMDIPLRIRKSNLGLLAAYDGILTEGMDLRNFFGWFREREELETEILKRKNGIIRQFKIYERLDIPEPYQFPDFQMEAYMSKSDQYPDSQLEAVRNALNNFLPEFSNFTVKKQPLRMEVEKYGRFFAINQLSDGEKCLIALIGDLARRMAALNPLSGNPLEGTGLVLIDEVDLHLHPEWQAMMIPKLLDVFPNCQFIISTNSTNIINNIKPENLFVFKTGASGSTVENPGAGRNTDSMGSSLEDSINT